MTDLEDEPQPTITPPRSRSRRVVQAALSVALVLAVFGGVLPRIADLSEVREEIGAMTAIEGGSLLLLGVWNLVSYALVYLSALPRLRLGQAMVVAQASTAIANTVPGGAGFGIGVTWAMLASWRFRRPEITLLVLVTGVWNVFAKLALPVVALALLAVQGGTTTGSIAAGAAGIGILVAAVFTFAVMLRSEAGARRVGFGAQRMVNLVRRVARRAPIEGWDASAASFRSTTNELLRRRWLPLTVSTLVSHLTLFAVLLLTLRHVGVSEAEVSSAVVLASFAFVRLISALPLTPGGLGVVELGLTAALVAAGGDRASVVASVLVYRAVTYLLPIPIGALSLLLWQRWSGRSAAQVSEGTGSSSVS
ncbi:MAG: YbhN family protein [Acidimicrobiales bacterium]